MMAIKTEHSYQKLILHWMGLDQIPPHSFDAYYRKLDENLQGDLSFNSLGPGKSWNIPQMRMAARVLHPSPGPAVRDDLYGWWHEYFDFQLGMVSEAEKSGHPNQLLSFFDGNEPFSPTYTPWRWGAVAGVRFAAKRDGRQDIVDLCDAWFSVAQWMALAMSVGEPDVQRQKNRKNQLFDNASAVSPVGERGASGHEITDTRLFLGHIFQPLFFTRRLDWPIKAFRLALPVPDPKEDRYDPTKLRWWSEQHVIHYPSGRLVYKPERKNWNTPCYMWDWYHYAEKTSTLGFPWPDGRQSKAKGSGRCHIVELAGGARMILAETEYDRVGLTLPNESILSHVVFGPEGFKKLA